jgi:hypothetical protein
MPNKPVTLHEQRLAAALDVATTRSSSPEAPSPPPTHVAEQAALRAETIAAFHSSAAVTGYAEQQEEGGLFTLREKTRDEVEQEEAEYRAYLEREVGPLEKILDLGEEEKAEGWIRRKEEEDMHVPLGEADSGKKNKKKKGKKVVQEREETDQEFLIKCVHLQHSIPHNISDKRYSICFFVVTFYTAVGSIAPHDAYLPTRRSPWGLQPPKAQVLQQNLPEPMLEMTRTADSPRTKKNLTRSPSASKARTISGSKNPTQHTSHLSHVQ